jgi:hypothetical protein
MYLSLVSLGVPQSSHRARASRSPFSRLERPEDNLQRPKLKNQREPERSRNHRKGSKNLHLLPIDRLPGGT